MKKILKGSKNRFVLKLLRGCGMFSFMVAMSSCSPENNYQDVAAEKEMGLLEKLSRAGINISDEVRTRLQQGESPSEIPVEENSPIENKIVRKCEEFCRSGNAELSWEILESITSRALLNSIQGEEELSHISPQPAPVLSHFDIPQPVAFPNPAYQQSMSDIGWEQGSVGSSGIPLWMLNPQTPLRRRPVAVPSFIPARTGSGFFIPIYTPQIPVPVQPQPVFPLQQQPRRPFSDEESTALSNFFNTFCRETVKNKLIENDIILFLNFLKRFVASEGDERISEYLIFNLFHSIANMRGSNNSLNFIFERGGDVMPPFRSWLDKNKTLVDSFNDCLDFMNPVKGLYKLYENAFFELIDGNFENFIVSFLFNTRSYMFQNEKLSNQIQNFILNPSQRNEENTQSIKKPLEVCKIGFELDELRNKIVSLYKNYLASVVSRQSEDVIREAYKNFARAKYSFECELENSVREMNDEHKSFLQQKKDILQTYLEWIKTIFSCSEFIVLDDDVILQVEEECKREAQEKVFNLFDRYFQQRRSSILQGGNLPVENLQGEIQSILSDSLSRSFFEREYANFVSAFKRG